MSETPLTYIDRRQLIDKLVLDRTTAETVGKVDRLWLDLNSHQVAGMTCKSGWLGRQKHTFAWGQIHAIGEDSLIVNAPEGAPLEKLESWETLVGHQLWTDGGNRAGTIVDYRFEIATGNVLEYLFTPEGGGRLTEGTYRLPVSAVVSVGSKRIIARESAVLDAPQDEPGATNLLDRAAEFLKEDYVKTRQHLAQLQQGSQELSDRLQEKLPQLRSEDSPPSDNAATSDAESLETKSLPPASPSPNVPLENPHGEG
ncbi:MAG TPA: PRC-barrel domain-containing protein [Oscillatoriales cyanobacterium M59_W2019_021]|nr:PRC-barrel domain-containing protein [Oscillatoriales cyanobacterium M4454_W2019_049]HIK49452.1 PRC-barrel domain-containing protein [Oscillatoriales cyanobacterium M59_W2019_021]